MNIRNILLIAAAMIGMSCRPPRAVAASFIYNFGSVLKGGTPASASTPWLTAQFTDVAPGQVEMTFTAPHLSGRESVRSFFLNLNPALNPCLLVFNQISSAGSFLDPKIRTGQNAFTAANSGGYDIRFQFSNGGGDVRAFGAGEQVTYLISGIPGLSASSFDFTSTLNCGKGPFYAAAQVNGTAPCNGKSWLDPTDGFVAVPEPAVALLFGSALAVWGVLRAWRRRRVPELPVRDAGSSGHS